MNGDRRKIGTTFLTIGVILFLIGMFDHVISDLIRDLNGDVRILGWGWILQLVGGLLAIYGFMTHLEEYLATTRPPHPGMPHPSPFPPLFFMDKEMKKVIWLLLIAALVIFVLSPGLQCQTILVILLAMVIIFLIMRREQRPYVPYPPPHYPPPQTLYQPPSAEPATPSKAEKVKLCEHCYAQLELDWVACPFCGQSISPKPVDKK